MRHSLYEEEYHQDLRGFSILRLQVLMRVGGS
jgi:hypothetical protein